MARPDDAGSRRKPPALRVGAQQGLWHGRTYGSAAAARGDTAAPPQLCTCGATAVDLTSQRPAINKDFRLLP